MTITYGPAMAGQVSGLADIADATLFPGEMLPGMIAPFLDGAEDALWLSAVDGEGPVGLTFLAPEEMADAVWNMKALAVAPERHRAGIGRGLVAAAEDALRAQGARMVLVDTSSDPAQRPAVAFYLKQAFRIEAVIRDFWSLGEDKITLTKVLQSGWVRSYGPIPLLRGIVRLA